MKPGREVITVRQIILAVILVGAAFLGGAFVTGPGFEWAQARVLRSLGLNNSDEIAAVSLGGRSNGTLALEPSDLLRQGSASSSSMKVPTMAIQDKSSLQDGLKKASVAQPAAIPLNTELDSNQHHPLSVPSVSATQLVTKSSAGKSVLKDSKVIRSIDDSGTTFFRSTLTHDKPTLSTLISPLAIVLHPSRSSSNLDRPLLTRHSAVLKSTKSTSNEWAFLQNRMQSLGITRFIIEGEPTGHVIFACFIPLAGSQAVTQQFEANGENVIQAAQAALRRVVLWRATQLSYDGGISSGEKNKLKK
jgi:hypothetical protein